MTDYRGLTWDHPRGTVALRRAAAEFSADPAHDDTLEWDSQALEGFESHPIEDLCARYDLVILDHPHLGDALAANALSPLEEAFDPATVAGWRDAAVGASGHSYTVAGQQWAAPLDAATQVAAADRARLERLPDTWDEVLALADTSAVALSLAGPHALLTFFSLCNALGEAPTTEPGRPLISGATGTAALELMRALYDRSGPATAGLNPIGLLELMAEGDGRLVYCPFVYGYVNYSALADGSPVRFGDVPRMSPDGPLGSVLGGTGLAVSRKASVSPALTAHLAALMSPETQRGPIPAHQGQPGLRQAWLDPTVDEAAGGFYSGTLATTEAAWVRPRYPGYTAFQTTASGLVRDGLLEGRAPGATLADLLSLHQASVRPMPSPAQA